MELICQLHLDNHVSTIQVGHPKLMVQCCVRRLSVLCMECIVTKRCEQKLLLRGRIKVMSTIALQSTLNILETVNDNGWFQGPPIGKGTWAIRWSRDR